jgi:diketogulonate reductase-like aldo/keto reductase
MADDSILIAGSGVRIPRIVYGTAWKKTRTEELVQRAIGLGFRGIDTACQPKHYDEAGVGAAVAACVNDRLRRTDLYLQTKFTPLSGHDPKQVPYDPKAPLAEQVAQSFETSLRNLRTDFVDCLVLHSPLSDPRQMAQAWQAMERVFDRGGARQLGISNCYRLDQLQALRDRARVKPAVIQNRFHAETNHDRDIRVFCRQRGIIYQSFWTLTANPHLLADAGIQALASKYRRTPAQVLFRYLTQQDVVPLTGTRTETHMREDLAIFDFELTGAELEAVTTLL